MPRTRKRQGARPATALALAALLAAAFPAAVSEGEPPPEAVRELVELSAAPHPDPLQHAVDLADAATRTQARDLGITIPSPQPPAPSAGPRAAVEALVAAYGGAVQASDPAKLAALDLLPEPARGALTAQLDAFRGLSSAARSGFGGASLAALTFAGGKPPSQALADAGVDLGPVFAARSAMLARAVDLRAAFAATPPAALPLPLQDCAPLEIVAHVEAGPIVVPLEQAPEVQAQVDRLVAEVRELFGPEGGPDQVLPPEVVVLVRRGPIQLLTLELAGCDTTHDAYARFSVDVGGHDTYRNNAGGTALGAGYLNACTITNLEFDLASDDLTAAALDLAGDDLYAGGPSCGIHGGGVHFASGNLVDAAGDDTYRAGAHGVNGGGNLAGAGLLVDASGRDAYEATAGSGGIGANGGAYLAGAGTLVDAGGDDAYTSHWGGVNGGAFAGWGFLADGAGNDQATGAEWGANGGSFLGAGRLFDGQGDDHYTATFRGANGGATAGSGLLYDHRGLDLYQDQEGGTGTDVTVVPKGSTGAQIDR